LGNRFRKPSCSAVNLDRYFANACCAPGSQPASQLAHLTENPLGESSKTGHMAHLARSPSGAHLPPTLAERLTHGHPAESSPGSHLPQSQPGPPGGESTWQWTQNTRMILGRPPNIVHASWLLVRRENGKRQVAGLPSGHSGV
jgi:hypothetical protein